MPNRDRLSGLDASFLAFERDGAHMHVGACLVFEGPAPSYDEVLALLEARLPLVPRYRQRLLEVPFDQGLPVWADDPHFNLGYHVRHTGLPGPAGDDELRTLIGRVFSQQLDRSKPLWEAWLVDRVGEDRFALITKTHHALVDGISGVDLASVLFAPEPPEPEGGAAWYPRPVPSAASLLADALRERLAEPVALARTLQAAARHPLDAAEAVARSAAGIGAMVSAAANLAPASPLNGPIGPHRSFTWVDEELARFQGLKRALGGTVNDVVLTVVTGALRTWYRRHAHRTDDVELRALVPVSVRADAERGALGNRVTAVYAPLPLWAENPLERFRVVHEAMEALKASAQPVGAETLTRLAGFATPTTLVQAARAQPHQRLFNLAVTNVPGPQFALYLAGRRLRAIYPMVPLAANARLGVAVLSYDGGLRFGLVVDQDAVTDLDVLAEALRAAVDELATAAGVASTANGSVRRTRRGVTT